MMMYHKALIDADAVAFLTASAIETLTYKIVHKNEVLEDGLEGVSLARDALLNFEGAEIKPHQEPKAFSLYTKNAKSMISNILEATKSSSFRLYTDKPGSWCFRFVVAIQKAYKDRKNKPLYPRPVYLDRLKHWCIDNLATFCVDKIETDDALGIVLTNYRNEGKKAISCANDKDMLQIEGDHYRMHRDHRDIISVEGYGSIFADGNKVRGTGNKFFLSQVLTGDPTDTYGGLKGCGSKSCLIQQLEDTTTFEEGKELVKGAYQSTYGSEEFTIKNHQGVNVSVTWLDLYREQSKLAWVLRKPL